MSKSKRQDLPAYRKWCVSWLEPLDWSGLLKARHAVEKCLRPTSVSEKFLELSFWDAEDPDIQSVLKQRELLLIVQPMCVRSHDGYTGTGICE